MTLKQRAAEAGMTVHEYVCEAMKRWRTQERAAEALGVHQTTVSRILRESGKRRWKRMTPAEQAEVIAAIKAGEPVRSVADRFDRTVSAINKLLSRRNLTRQTTLVSL